ncbi:hypothetical protein BH23THE1_BH23THE1_35890 [soil metagenome]
MDVNPFILNQFRENFSSFIQHDPDQKGQLELEVRFGYFLNNKFNSRLIDTCLYRNIRDHLDKLQERHPEVITKRVVTKIIDHDNHGIRRITKLPDQVCFQRKNKVINYDNEDWGLRFAKSYEINLQMDNMHDFTPISRRYCNRLVYIDRREGSYFYGFKIELSEVTSDGKRHYELEMEALPSMFPSFDNWWGSIKTLYGWMLNATNSDQIISIKERSYISNKISFHLGNPHNMLLSPSLVNRPLTLRRLNDVYDRAISLKIDGEHKILVFCKYGVYSCSSAFNIVKIGEAIDNSLSIIECEYISATNQYFMFDILINQDHDVRIMAFRDRYNCLNKFVNQVKYGTIIMKRFYLPNQRDQLLHDYNNSQLPLDGLIFQSLGSYKDNVYKWKPLENLTVDFYLTRVEPQKWSAYVLKSKRFVQFCTVCSECKSPELFDNKIVECRWNLDRLRWEPVRIRYDKLGPNSFFVARSNVSMLENPITFESIVHSI